MNKIIGMLVIMGICGNISIAKDIPSALKTFNMIAENQGDISVRNNGNFPVPMAVKIESEQKLSKTTEVSFQKLNGKTGLQNLTPYDAIKEFFERGTPATEKDLTGWHSGRSIYPENQKKLIASLFVGRLAPLKPNGDKKVFLVNSFIRQQKDHCTYYDNPGYGILLI